MIGSTILNTILIKLGVDRTISFCTTLFIFAFVNYYVLRYMNMRVVKATDSKNNSTKESKNNGGRQDKSAQPDKKKKSAVKARGGAAAIGFRGGAAFVLHDFVVSTGVPVERPRTAFRSKLGWC